MTTESVLNWLPDAQSRKPVRQQFSCSIEEATELDSILRNPLLPFSGDATALLRTFLRYGIAQLHFETNVAENSFLQSQRPMIGSELLKWSAANCDNFAMAGTDHLALSVDSGDSSMAQDVVQQVASVVEEVTNASAKAMLKRALAKRGFLSALGRLRQMLLDEGESVYSLDTLEAEVFA